MVQDERLNIEKSDVIDAIGLDDNTTMRLMIIDGLDWHDELRHLELLQKKLNTYIYYIEQEMYKERYPNVSSIIINIKFLFKEHQSCRMLLSNADAVLKDAFDHVSLEVEYGSKPTYPDGLVN